MRLPGQVEAVERVGNDGLRLQGGLHHVAGDRVDVPHRLGLEPAPGEA